MRSAVPLALAVSIAEELPHLRGIPAGTAEFVGQHLLTLLFMVVIADLIMQTLLMRRWVASQQNSQATVVAGMEPGETIITQSKDHRESLTEDQHGVLCLPSE